MCSLQTWWEYPAKQQIIVCFGELVFYKRYSPAIHVMKSGLDPTIFKPHVFNSSPNSPPLLVFVGRLAIEKNISFLLSALANPALSHAHLLIVGDGPERNRLEAYAASVVGPDSIYSLTRGELEAEQVVEIARSKRVVFTGMVYNEEEIAKYYAAGDVFVSASASETFGFTVAEGLSFLIQRLHVALRVFVCAAEPLLKSTSALTTGCLLKAIRRTTATKCCCVWLPGKTPAIEREGLLWPNLPLMPQCMIC